MRTTPTGTGTTTSPPRPYPKPTMDPTPAVDPAPQVDPSPPAADVEDALPAPAVDGDPGAGPRPEPAGSEDPPATADRSPEPDSRAETRRALRAARRRRRRVMVACGLVIAVCLVLTVLIVGIARDRRPGPRVVTPGVSIGPPAPVGVVTAVQQSIEYPGAAAPEGEHR